MNDTYASHNEQPGGLFAAVPEPETAPAPDAAPYVPDENEVLVRDVMRTLENLPQNLPLRVWYDSAPRGTIRSINIVQAVNDDTEFFPKGCTLMAVIDCEGTPEGYKPDSEVVVVRAPEEKGE